VPSCWVMFLNDRVARGQGEQPGIGPWVPAASLPAELVAFTRKKVEPTARGLFRRDEQEAVLAVLEKSVVFLTLAYGHPSIWGGV
jgi:hypothetical protein